MPNSRFALHGLAPPQFSVCAPFLPLIHGLCTFFRVSLSVHGLHFTVYAPLTKPPKRWRGQRLGPLKKETENTVLSLIVTYR